MQCHLIKLYIKVNRIICMLESHLTFVEKIIKEKIMLRHNWLKIINKTYKKFEIL